MNAWRHLKLRNFPTFQKRPRFSSEILFTTMWHEQKKAKSPRTWHFNVLLCMFHRTADTTKHTVKYVCVWKRWMGVQSGVLQGLGTGIVKHPPLLSPLSLTHTSLHIFYRYFPRAGFSQVLCNREETHPLSTLPLQWRRLYMSGGYVHVWTVAAHGAGLVTREGRRSRQASIGPLMRRRVVLCVCSKGYLSSSPQITDNHGDRARRGWPTFFIL